MANEILWYRGDSWPKGFLLVDKDTSLPLDLTGYGVKLTVDTRKDPTDETTQVFQVVGVVDPDQVVNKGKLTFTPTAVQTDQLPVSYYYDIEMTDTSAHNRTIRKDKFKMLQDITK